MARDRPGTKEEVVLDKMGEVGHQVAAALNARPAGERPWDSLRRAFDVVAQTDPDEPERALSLMRLLSDAWAASDGTTPLSGLLDQAMGALGELSG
ncbi:hypothetical protein ACIBO2_29140 [Nonomuraea sp. NPDC050022]|uniref:hypothetical protein n=1 Tax=unclassified Nonomuraea TaxID=2593643 RepID=UPI00340D29EC